MPPWIAAFFAACGLSLFAVPLLRRIAIAVDFVDVPDRRKVHRDPVPYLGGVALILAVLSALIFETRLSTAGAVLAAGAALLGTMGLIDDDRHLSPSVRLFAEVAAAVIAVAVGLRIHGSGVEQLDIALTIVWIVGVTNAFNLLDNMDGLAAGVAAVASFVIFMLALLAGQPVVATIAAATFGACLGFLVYNRPPASIFMGDAGSLFLGFVLAVLTVDLNLNPLAPPFSFAVPLMLLAVPVLDTTTVTLARLRRRRPVWLGGTDHLSHRLVKRGLSRRGAVGVLVGVEALLGVLALLAGRRVIPLWTAALATLIVIGALSANTIPVRVYREQVRGLPRSVRLGMLALVVGVPALAAPAMSAMLRARPSAQEAAAVAERALDALSAGDVDRTVAEFATARQSFAEARDRLNGPLTSVGLVIPGLSSNLRAARVLVDIGVDLSTIGGELVTVSKDLPVEQGRVSLDEVRRLTPVLERSAFILNRSERRLKDVDRGLLIPELSKAVEDLQRRVAREAAGISRAVDSARLLPAILGGEGPRRYFLAFQNNTEMRGSGGLIGNWGELVAENGQIRLSRFGRLQELNDARTPGAPVQLPEDFLRRWSEFDVLGHWQQVNVSPDFPTTARVISELYPHSGGQRLDGVIALDPPGLASLLELTGPVTVPGWPDPVSSTNVVDITLRDAYARFPQDSERIQFLGEVARSVTEAFTTAELGSPPMLARVLNAAAQNRHLMVWMANADEQRLMENLGADGAVPDPAGDSLLVVNQNLAANKVDYYLRRTISYNVSLDPDRRPATVEGRVDVVLANGAAAQGLPTGVIGPYDDRFVAGENRAYVSVYGSLIAGGATLDGQPLDMRSQRDLGRPVKSAVVSVPALQASTLTVPVRGNVELTPEGWYRLDLPHQPTLAPDDVRVGINLADGWKVAEVRGARRVSDEKVEAAFSQSTDHTIWVRVERTGVSKVWNRLLGRL